MPKATPEQEAWVAGYDAAMAHVAEHTMSKWFRDFLDSAGLDELGAERMIRLAATAALDGWSEALLSFSDAEEVDQFAVDVGRRLYPETTQQPD